MSKRILHIVSTLERTGVAKQLCLLATGLPRDEFETHVCTLAPTGPLAAELQGAGITPTSLGKRWTLDPRAFWRLKEQIARLRPDVIHAWTAEAAAYAHVAGRLCGEQRLVMGLRNIGPNTTRLELGILRALARRAHGVVVDSEGTRDNCVGHGLPGESMRVIPNGVVLPDASNSTRRQMLESLGLPEGIRLIGWIGRLSFWKRLKDAIWAADLLKVIRDDVHLLVIGDGPMRDEYRQFRDHVRIRDKVHFLGERADVAELLPCLDVLWATSEHEGQSNAILEAMAAGIPVVATNIPGTQELVVSGTTGYLVPVGDRAAMAKHTERLLNDTAMAARYGDAGRQRATEFSAQKMVDRYAALYRRVMQFL